MNGISFREPVRAGAIALALLTVVSCGDDGVVQPPPPRGANNGIVWQPQVARVEADPDLHAVHWAQTGWQGPRFWYGGDRATTAESEFGADWSLRTYHGTGQVRGFASTSNAVAKIVSGGEVRSTVYGGGGSTGYYWSIPFEPIAVAGNDNDFVVVGPNGAVAIIANGTDLSTPTSNVGVSFTDVVWTGATFVASTLDGRIQSSTDGVTWQPVVHSLGEPILAVSNRDGVTVALTASGLYWLTGTDPWNEGIKVDGLRDVASDGTRFVAVGTGGSVYMSANGKTWWDAPAVTSSDLNSVAVSTQQIVAVGDEGTIVVRPNGGEWRVRQPARPHFFMDVAWTGDEYIAVASPGGILRSPDGKDWTMASIVPQFIAFSSVSVSPQGAIIAGNTIAGYYSTQHGAVVVSSDHDNWALDFERLDIHAFYCSAWTGSHYLVGGPDGVLMKSLDGHQWTDVADDPTTSYYAGIAASPDAVVAVLGSGEVTRFSTDLSTHDRYIPDPGVRFMDVVWNGDAFYAATTTSVLTLSDGRNWEDIGPGLPGGIYDIAARGSELVICGYGFVWGLNGVDWKEHSIDTHHTLFAVESSPAGFITMGEDGVIRTLAR